MHNFYIFCIIFIYFIYYLYIFIFYIYSIYLYICTLYIFPTPIYTLRILSLSIYYITHTPLCITSAEGDLSLRDKHLSVVFSLRSKPNKQFNISSHNYSFKKFYIHIYIILVKFFTNPLLNTLS